MADDKSLQDRIEQLTERISYLEYLMREQAGRIYAIEQRIGLAPRPVDYPPPVANRPATPSQGETVAGPPPSPVLPQQAPPYTDVRPPAPPPQTTPLFQTPTSASPDFTQQLREKPRANLEDRIGGSWFNRIGVLCLCLAVAFFLKYAFDNQWIGPAGRVSIGVIIGLGFFVCSARLLVR